MNIRSRLTLQFTLLVSTLILLMLLMVYYLRVRYVEDTFYRRLKKKAESTAELISRSGKIDAELLNRIDRSNYDVFFAENLAIYDYTLRELYTSNDSVHYNLYPSLIERIKKEGEVRFVEGTHQIIGILYDHPPHKLVSIAGAVDKGSEESLINLRNILIWMYVLAVAFVATTGWYFSGRALAPISRVIGQVKQLFPNQLDQSLNVENPNDEIGQLTLTFNELLTKIADVVRLQNLFISNVSHELKNPLMRMGAQLDVAMLKERSPEEYQKLISSVRDDIRGLGQLSETLLELVKVNDQARQVIYGSVRVDEVIWEARTLLLHAEPTYQVSVEFEDNIDHEAQLTLYGNAQLLQMVFVNLMENGCKFSSDGKVNVLVYFHKNGLKIDFKNHGKLIPQAQIPLIFQPFYRGDSTSTIKGYGVGLSLVERIVKLHAGYVVVWSDEKTSTNIFTLHLPYQPQK